MLVGARMARELPDMGIELEYFLLFFYFVFTEHTQVTPGLPMLQSFHNIYTNVIVIIVQLFHHTF